MRLASTRQHTQQRINDLLRARRRVRSTKNGTAASQRSHTTLASPSIDQLHQVTGRQRRSASPISWAEAGAQAPGKTDEKRPTTGDSYYGQTYRDEGRKSVNPHQAIAMIARSHEKPRSNRGHRRAGLRRSFLVALSVIGLVVLLIGGLSAPALGATPDCHLTPDAAHCHGIHVGDGTTFYGMAASWNRANMTTPSDALNPQFVTSEMWFLNSCGNIYPFVEEGLTYEYDSDAGQVEYEAFYGWGTSPTNIGFAPIAYLSPNGGVTDDYQISAPSGGIWNIWWDGNHYTTGGTGFNSGTCLQMGAEVASTGACAQTFNMYSQAYNSAGQKVNWAYEFDYFDPPGIGGVDLNGYPYQDSEWSWNTVQGGC